MRGFSKKILISLLTTLVVFITVFATTYAWVGIFTYANTDSFKMNLKVQDLDSNYYLTISSSGNLGTFSDSINTLDIERQIVTNHYNSYYDEGNESIHNIFQKLKILPVSTILNDNNTLSNFEKMNFDNPNRLQFIEADDYFKFDLYLSVDTKEGITPSTTGIKANVLLDDIENTLTGSITSGFFINDNPFTDLPSNSVNDVLKNIPHYYSINSKNVARVALLIYDPINVNDVYNGDELPIDSKVFYGGDHNPSYISQDNTYDLGGVLPLEQNTALQELKITQERYFNIYSIDYLNFKLDQAIENESKYLSLTQSNNYIWKKYEHTDNYLGCMNGIQTKMKIEVYFWFEGWDSDCMKIIANKSTTLNLAFTSGTDD